jgi:excisionase family DNA binding protein
MPSQGGGCGLSGDLKPADVLTVEQLAERLKVPVSWVYKHANNGLPTLRCGRYLRFSWPEVCEWLRQAKH